MDISSGFFTLEAQSGQARAGLISTAHGKIQTPVFMPVGTRASVKTLYQEQLKNLNAPIILGNTYHLYLRPGHQLIEKLGGLHKFMNWSGAILTDSGGYQVFSLADINKVTGDGVKFQSHIDGSYHLITPEKSMEIQRSLGSDIVMAFDECPALPASYEKLQSSVELSLNWAKRCCQVPLKSHQFLFGIIQGGLYQDLRQYCLDELRGLDFAGYALGGLSVGEKNEQMVSFCQDFVPQMPVQKPRYLMGVGKPVDILRGIRAGLDMFDCVLPTRNARNGQVFTTDGALNIKNKRFKEDTRPLDPEFENAMSGYSRAYIRHLFMCGEYLAGQILSYHNIAFYLKMLQDAREAILNNEYEKFFANFVLRFESGRWKA